jgi:diguanylate cyclase (GGDEF)-like protein
MLEKKQQLYATTHIWKRSLYYAVFMFVFAISLLVLAHSYDLGFKPEFSWMPTLFFLLVGFFTICKGFNHATYGYVSFDRIAQVSSLVILGPVIAAIINGIASFIFPMFSSSYLGNDKRAIAVAVFNNSAMKAIMVLLSGLLFELLGGKIPMSILDVKQLFLLLFLLLSMQLINSLCMRVLFIMRQQNFKNYFNTFSIMFESVAGLAGVVFALVYIHMNFVSFILFTILLLIAILIVNQFAIMRSELEQKVLKRTQDLEDKSKQLEFLATHDELTGLVNRRYINSHIKILFDMQAFDNKSIFIAYTDIDDFKRINDTYSHEVGDEVLIKIAEILQQFSNEMLIIARYGGEEFLLCFDSTTKEQVMKTCEMIRHKIESLDFTHIDNHIKITISIGVVNANDESLHRNVIQTADNNLYKAKANGKNQIIYSD